MCIAPLVDPPLDYTVASAQDNGIFYDDNTGKQTYNYKINNVVTLAPQFLLAKQVSQDINLLFGVGAAFSDTSVVGAAASDGDETDEPDHSSSSYSKTVWLMGPLVSVELDYAVSQHVTFFIANSMAYLLDDNIGSVSYTGTVTDASLVNSANDSTLSGGFTDSFSLGVKIL
ncbi:MAG: hypothetical protein A3J38_03455 [Gammaproteobacteria bacterium RIFCSPHIGHO2_12_FULL_45_9]|nr:MAG: hypothetical protein A3J38_03455 [Gammaproteobacteria bacterium RIFCSPHIGHO2_12_FULL_45_9]